MDIPIKCIIFDFDGTLVDTKTYYLSLVAEYLGSQLESVKDKAELTTFSKISHTESNIKWKIPLAAFRASQKLGYSKKKSLGAVVHLIRQHSEDFHRARPTPHLKEALSMLYDGNIPLAILSHSSRRKVIGFLDQYFPDGDYFRHDLILTAGEFGKHKESGIKKILSLLNLEDVPSECCILGDLGGDVIAGKNSGLTTFGLTTGYSTYDTLAKAEPNAIFNNVLEMAKYIL
ncbi:MAG: HAD family hydrolase [Candidatus Hodarchaeales archaeon]